MKKTKKHNQKGGKNKSIKYKYLITKNNFKNKNKNIPFICSPRQEQNNFTCFSKKALKKIIEQYNSNNNDKISVKESMNKHELWNNINNKLKSKCDTEYCWIKQRFLNTSSKSLNKYFKPKKPKKWSKNKNEWLTTIDIEDVLNQYEKKFPEFYFVGAVPIDFDKKLSLGECVINELCNISLKSLLNKNKNKIGVVFNLDKHDEPGSHWVSFFVDLTKDEIYYFDSYGVDEPQEVTELMNRLKEQGNKLGRNIKLFTNQTRHQFKNSECGIYSINFIVRLLEGENYKDISNNIIKDDEIERFRNIFFIDDEIN